MATIQLYVRPYIQTVDVLYILVCVPISYYRFGSMWAPDALPKWRHV